MLMEIKLVKFFWISITCDSSYALRTDKQSNERTDITRLIIVLRNYVNAHSNIESF